MSHWWERVHTPGLDRHVHRGRIPPHPQWRWFADEEPKFGRYRVAILATGERPRWWAPPPPVDARRRSSRLVLP